MNDIILNSEFGEQVGFKESFKIIISNKCDISKIEELKLFIDRINEDEALFKYRIEEQGSKADSDGISIEFLFDINNIHMVYCYLDSEIKRNSMILERLNEHEPLSNVSQILFRLC